MNSKIKTQNKTIPDYLSDVVKEKIINYKQELNQLFTECIIDFSFFQHPDNQNTELIIDIIPLSNTKIKIAILSITLNNTNVNKKDKMYIPSIKAYGKEYTGNKILTNIQSFINKNKLSNVSLDNASKIDGHYNNKYCKISLSFFYSLVHGHRWYSKYGFQIVNKEIWQKTRKNHENKSVQELRDSFFKSVIKTEKYNDIIDKLHKYLNIKFTNSSTVKAVFAALNNKKNKDNEFICFIEEIFDSFIDKYKELNKTIGESVQMEYKSSNSKSKSFFSKFTKAASNLSSIHGGKTTKKKRKGKVKKKQKTRKI